MEVPEKKLVILDLDETLVFATEVTLERAADFEIEGYFVYTRPFLSEFLSYCFEAFDVGIWTNATKGYAEAILDQICPERCIPVLVWTRGRCTWSYDAELQEGFFVKKLEKLRRRGFRRESIIAIDDTALAWRFSYGNLVNVKRFEGDPDDDELALLMRYLMRLATVSDVRAKEKRNWRAGLD